MNDELRLLSDKNDMRALGQRLRAEGRSVVTINGCFDLIHRGHIHMLRGTAKHGDILIVGLNSDVSVRAYKGPDRPILPENERAAILLALEFVDYVCLYDEVDCTEFIRAIRPDVHITDDSCGDSPVDAPTVKEVGGRLVLLPKIDGLSTTSIVEKMRS